MRSKGNGKRKPAGDSKGERTSTVRLKRMPQNHRTIDRVTHIREQVVYNPGMTFAELVRALDAAKSSVHGFISGLLATGWLYQEQHRFYLGPAVYGLTLASGHIRAGLVTREDLVALQQETGVAAFQISRGCEETTVRLPRARRSVARDVRDRPAESTRGRRCGDTGSLRHRSRRPAGTHKRHGGTMRGLFSQDRRWERNS